MREGLLPRRRWLRLALGAGGALAAGVGSLGWWLRWSAPPVGGLHVIAAHEHRTLAALVEVLFPPGSLGDLDVHALELPRQIDAFLRDEPAPNVSDLRDAITFLELGPLIDRESLTPFSRMPRDAREAYFASWIAHEDLLRRKVALAFRKLLNLMLYDHDEVWPLIGYPGPALGARAR